MNRADRRRIPKRLRLPHNDEPHACNVVFVDSAANSGIAATGWYDGESHGVARHWNLGDKESRSKFLLKEALDTLRADASVWCLERPWGGRGRGGLRHQLGRWLEALLTIGVPSSRILKVYPAVWQSAVLPSGCRGDTKAESRAMAVQLYGVDSILTSEDECDALCGLTWAQTAPETYLALPKRYRESAMPQYAARLKEAQAAQAAWLEAHPARPRARAPVAKPGSRSLRT